MFESIISYLLAVIVGIIFYWLYIKIAVWLRKRKYPEDSYISGYTDEREAMDAFTNPHDPILNPQASKPK